MLDSFYRFVNLTFAYGKYQFTVRRARMAGAVSQMEMKMITIVDNDKKKNGRESGTSVELTTLKYCYCVNIFVEPLRYAVVVILSRQRALTIIYLSIGM